MPSAPGWGLAQMEWAHFPLLGRSFAPFPRALLWRKEPALSVSTLSSVWEASELVESRMGLSWGREKRVP